MTEHDGAVATPAMLLSNEERTTMAVALYGHDRADAFDTAGPVFEAVERILSKRFAPLIALADRLAAWDLVDMPVPHSVDVPDDYEAAMNDAGAELHAVLKIAMEENVHGEAPDSREQEECSGGEFCGWACDQHEAIRHQSFNETEQRALRSLAARLIRSDHSGERYDGALLTRLLREVLDHRV